MKRVLIVIVMALLGIGLFAYPAVSNYIFARNCSTATQTYDDTIAQFDAAAIKKAWAEAEIYNENLEGNPVHDPFLAGSGMVMADNYFDVLNQGGDGIMGYIDIPKIAVKIPIYHGTAEATLLKGIGHLEGSSMPTGGVGTHSVLTGHTGLANAKMFTDLVKLGVGDVFYLHILDQTLAYKINAIPEVVLPEKTDSLKRVSGKDYCTLVTCTPYGINSHRLLVRGERTEYIPSQNEPTPIAAVIERFKDWDMLIGLGVGVALIAVIILIVVLLRRKKRTDDEEVETPPMERSDNPWAILETPTETPGGTTADSSPPNSKGKKHRPKRKKKGKKFWWEEDRG